MLWKKVSELNELIKWKRNITIQWDILLSHILWTPEKFRIHKQIDYDYFFAKQNFIPPQEHNITQSFVSLDTPTVPQNSDLLTDQPNSLSEQTTQQENQSDQKENIFINF